MEYYHQSYPKITQLSPNKEDSLLMLSNLNGIHSVMNLLSLYYYNSIILSHTNKELQKIYKLLLKIKCRQFTILCRSCFLLGADPRLWYCHHDSMEYWSPSFNIYNSHMTPMIEYSINEEQHIIDIYYSQINKLNNQVLSTLLLSFIKDNQYSISLLSHFLNQTNF